VEFLIEMLSPRGKEAAVINDKLQKQLLEHSSEEKAAETY
jgi:hypothetical protein